jgi:tripartite-type tricarboxylate transporter receptor subunit TctC
MHRIEAIRIPAGRIAHRPGTCSRTGIEPTETDMIRRPAALFLSIAGLLQATSALGAAPAPRGSYPDRPIRLLVPNAPGSATDVIGRVVAAGLSEETAQPVLIDNRAGASGLIALEIGRSALPDGYTMVFATPAITIAPALQPRPAFDPLLAFDFVLMLGRTPNALAVTPDLPVKSVADLVAMARAKKGQLNMASAGAGSQSHLAGSMMLTQGKIDALHVPYKSASAAAAAVASGESHWILTPAPAALGLGRAGRLRLIGHSLTRRTPLLGDMPAIAETIPGFDYSSWNGIIAPLGVSRATLDTLTAALRRTMARTDVRDGMALQAMEIELLGPTPFRQVVQATAKQNAGLVKALGLKAE